MCLGLFLAASMWRGMDTRLLWSASWTRPQWPLRPLSILVPYMLTQATKILRQFAHHLSRILVSPHCALEVICTIGPGDTACLENWNQVRSEPGEDCIHDLIEIDATAQPDEPAISAWDGDLMYEQLSNLSSRVAEVLVEQAVCPEVVVPIYIERSKWTAVAMLAVLKAGGAFLLLDPAHSNNRIEAICRTVEARTVIASSPLVNTHSPDFSPMHLLSVEDAEHHAPLATGSSRR